MKHCLVAILLLVAGCHHETTETPAPKPAVKPNAGTPAQQALDFVNQSGRDIRSATTVEAMQPTMDKLLGIVVRARNMTKAAQSSSQAPPPGLHFWNRTAMFLLDACLHQGQIIHGTRPHADQSVDAYIAKARDTSRYCDIPMP